MRPEPHQSVCDVWRRYGVETASFADIDSRIHVWRVGLDDVDAAVASALSAEETARADRFPEARDRTRFIAARGVLRAILADLLEQEPKGQALRFGYGAAGKPFLLDDPSLHFNVSHSEGIAVIAATRAGAVGIDIERQRRMADMEQIARMVFNEAERTAMLGCPAAGREAVFYRIWTRKEALLKAMGVGLPALGDPEAASLAHAGTAWLVTGLPHLDGYVAALARPRNAHGMKLWSWPGPLAMRSAERRARPRAVLVAPSPFGFELRR